jgi:hypothetical protein
LVIRLLISSHEARLKRQQEDRGKPCVEFTR